MGDKIVEYAAVSPEEAREQIGRVLASEQFVNSGAPCQILTLLLDAYLSREPRVKEIEIGIRIFKKPEFDGKKSSTVRATIRRVRTKLTEYCENEGRHDSLRAIIPIGSYELRFIRPQAEAEAAIPEPQARAADNWVWKIAAAGAALVALAVGADRVAEVRFGRGRALEWHASSKPITFDGRRKIGPFLIDGMTLYFREETGANREETRSVPIAGGEPARVSLPPPLSLVDLPYGRSFLLLGSDERDQFRFWNWMPGQQAEPLELESARGQAVRLSDTEQAGTQTGRVFVRRRLSSGWTETWVPVPGQAADMSWEPRSRRLRFTVRDFATLNTSIWEMEGINGTPHTMAPFPKGAEDGHWNSSGDIFTFVTRGTPNMDFSFSEIWMADERPPASREHPRIARAIDGPLAYYSPVSTPDGRQLFAGGDTATTELMRMDLVTREFNPYLGGINAIETDFSRDGEWIAYVSYPQRTLWKVARHGGEPVRLTNGAFLAIQPQWSPDGARIALMGQRPGQHARVYVMAADGSGLRELGGKETDQGIPTWSPDGKRLVFGDLKLGQPFSAMTIHVADVARGSTSTLPGSEGRWTPRWSPDGRWIAAVSADNRELRLYDVTARRWEKKPAASVASIESPAWTANSAAIYFRAVSGDGKGRRVIEKLDMRLRRLTEAADLANMGPAPVSWCGVTPEGAPLIAKFSRNSDIYAISLSRN